MAEATGLWDAESIIFNRGRSVTLWTFTGRVFHHAQRPVEQAPTHLVIITWRPQTIGKARGEEEVLCEMK